MLNDLPTLLPTLTTVIDGLAAWFLTYLIHSTLLLATATLVTRWLSGELALKETLWKTALFGGILTATLQLAFGADPLTVAWTLGSPEPGQTATVAPESAASGAILGAASDRPAPTAYFVPTGRKVDWASAPTVEALPHTSRWAAGRRAFAIAWCALAVVLLGALVLSYVQLRRRLVERRAVTDGPDRATLDELVETTRSRRPVELFATPSVRVPLACGVTRRQIHLPKEGLDPLAAERRALVLAHELAHLERRDPVWLLATRLVEAALCAQPLNRYARRQLQEIAEYRADDWAVAQTGRPVGLAKCLAEIAEWTTDPAAWATAPAIATSKTRLGRRVERLLSRDYRKPAERSPRSIAALAAALLAVVVLAAPGVRSVEAEAAASSEVHTATASTTPATSARPNPDPRPEPRPEPVPDSQSKPEPKPDPRPEPTPSPRVVPTAPAAIVGEGPIPVSPTRPVVAPPVVAPLAPRPIAPLSPRVLASPPVAPMAPSAEELEALEELATRMADFEIVNLDRMSALAEELAELAIPDTAALEELHRVAGEMASAALEDPANHERLQALALELAETQKLTAEQRAERQREMQALVESMRPSDEELAALQAQARALQKRSRLSAEERAQLEREIEQARLEVEREVEAHRHEIEREVEAARELLEGRREEMEREVERARREVEAQREEIERSRRELVERREEIREEIERERRDEQRQR